MFSLIISLVSIALVVALVAATIYYGGISSEKAATRASAAMLVNQASQINAAGLLAVSGGTGRPTENPSFGEPYLSSMPVPPKSAYADLGEVPDSSHWTYYIPPTSPTASHHFVLKNKISRSVCMAVNKEQGVVGIPAVWDGQSLIQCFGRGIAARTGSPLGYTFFYDPVGTSAAQKAAALAQSKDEGGSGTPGYPRMCPDGSTIETGLCVDSTPVEVPSGPNGYSLVSVAGVLNVEGLDGTDFNFQSYCSADLPLDAVTPESTLTIGQVPASIDDVYRYGGTTCIDSYGNPPHAAGTLEVLLTNPNGSAARGTIVYVDNIAPAPTILQLSPQTGLADVETRISILGQNFEPGVKVYVEWARSLPATFISSTQIEVTLPVAATLGFSSDDRWPAHVAVIVVNPGSDPAATKFVPQPGSEAKHFEYYQAVSTTITPGEPVQLSVEESLPEGGGLTYLCPVATGSSAFANGGYVKWGSAPEVFVDMVFDNRNTPCLPLQIPAGEEGEIAVAVRAIPDGSTTNFSYNTVFTYRKHWFVPGTHQVIIGVSATPAWMENGIQTSLFASYRAVKDCSHLPGLGASFDGYGEFCIPALNADYETWSGLTGQEYYNDEYYQTGFVLTDGTHTYTFLYYASMTSDAEYPLTMLSGVVAGPLGTPDMIPAPPNYGCGGYCDDPRVD